MQPMTGSASPVRRRLLGLPVAFQGVKDYLILAAETAGHDLVVDVSLQMFG